MPAYSAKQLYGNQIKTTFDLTDNIAFQIAYHPFDDEGVVIKQRPNGSHIDMMVETEDTIKLYEIKVRTMITETKTPYETLELPSKKHTLVYGEYKDFISDFRNTYGKQVECYYICPMISNCDGYNNKAFIVPLEYVNDCPTIVKQRNKYTAGSNETIQRGEKQIQWDDCEVVDCDTSNYFKYVVKGYEKYKDNIKFDTERDETDWLKKLEEYKYYLNNGIETKYK